MPEFTEMIKDEGQLPNRETAYRVGECEVHASLNTIVRGDRTFRCEPRVIDVLLCLILHAPEPVSKEQLQAEVWPSTTVSSDAIWRCVSELRRLLNDPAREPAYIETIPRRGYRVIASVEPLATGNRLRASVPASSIDQGAPAWRSSRVIGITAAVAMLSIATLFFLFSGGDRRARPQSGAVLSFSSFEAYTAFTTGRLLNLRDTPEDVVRAVEHLQTATDLDPNSALGHSELALALIHAGRLRALPRDDAFGRAKQAAVRAVELDGSLGEAHAALGSVLFWHERRWAEAADSMGTALDLEPENARAHRDYALFLGARGRHEEAEKEIGNAWRLDHSTPRISLEAGWIYYYGGRFNDAIDECRFARDLNPESRDVRSCLLAAYIQAGRHREALEVVRELATERGVNLAVAPLDDSRDAFESAVGSLLTAAEDNGEFESLSALDAARLHMTLGQTEPALRWIEQASAERYTELAHLNVDPFFSTLRSDPRFRRLLEQLGFPT